MSDYFPADAEPAAPRFSTRQDAIEQAIMPALAGSHGEYDHEAICHEAFDWKIDVNEQGQQLGNSAGYEQVVSAEEFWDIVAKHEIA